MLHKKVSSLVFLLALSLASCQQKTAPARDINKEKPHYSSVPHHPQSIATEWHDVASFGPYQPGDPRPVTYGRIEVRPGLWLVIEKWEYDTSYFIQRGTMGRMLAPAIDQAEIELVTPDVIRFRSYESEGGFHPFPHRITYNVDSDELITDYLYWDCAEPFRFNYSAKVDQHEPLRDVGHEVLDIAAEGDTVTVWFSPMAEFPKWDRPPETTTTFHQSTCTFSVLFAGSKVGQKLIDKTGGLGPTAACRFLALAQVPEGVQLRIGLTQPMEYRVDYVSGGGLSMTIWLKSK